MHFQIGTGDSIWDRFGIDCIGLCLFYFLLDQYRSDVLLIAIHSNGVRFSPSNWRTLFGSTSLWAKADISRSVSLSPSLPGPTDASARRRPVGKMDQNEVRPYSFRHRRRGEPTSRDIPPSWYINVTLLGEISTLKNVMGTFFLRQIYQKRFWYRN